MLEKKKKNEEKSRNGKINCQEYKERKQVIIIIKKGEKKKRCVNERTFELLLDNFCWWMMRKEAPDVCSACLAHVLYVVFIQGVLVYRRRPPTPLSSRQVKPVGGAHDQQIHPKHCSLPC